VDEVEGLTAMTMIGSEKERVANFSNAALPAMAYEPKSPRHSMTTYDNQRDGSEGEPDGNENGLRQRSASDSHLNLKGDKSDHKQTLAYWKLEKQLRLAGDQLASKSEEVSTLQEHKSTLEREMDDLTVTLFEEAHEMVRVEKEARHKDHVLLKETQDQTEVLMAELKALKELVAHMRKNNGKDPAYIAKGKGGKAPAPRPEVPQPEKQRQYDSNLFTELLKWHTSPSLSAGSDFIKRVTREDVEPCIAFHPKTAELSAKLLAVVKAGELVLEEKKDATTGDVCALSLAKRSCPHRIRFVASEGAAPEYLSITQLVRNRLIALAELYRYLGYITKGLVKAPIDVVYWKVIKLRSDVSRTRLGLGIEP